jgi:transcriptional regulator with XRE-family HTH domain
LDVARQDTKSDQLYGAIVDGLIRHRKQLRMTQWTLAQKVGTDQSQISKFERRERRIDIADYARICEALDLDPCLLLRRDGHSQRQKSRRKPKG